MIPSIGKHLSLNAPLRKTILSSIFLLLFGASSANAQVIVQPNPNYLISPIIPSGQVQCNDGTVSAPCYSWLNDLDSGWYRIGANNIGLALNGIKQVDYSTTRVAFTPVIYGPDGLVGAPAYSFTNDPTSGLYLNGSSIYMALQGAIGFQFFNSGMFGIQNDLFLGRDAANTLAQRNGASAQSYKIYGTTTGPRYMALSHDGTNGKIDTEGAGSILLGGAAHVGSGVDGGVDLGTASARFRNTNISGQFISTQGTITASNPFISHTATWNDAGVTFVDDFRNITSTASAAGSLLAQWQVGGVDVFSVRKDGLLAIIGSGRFAFGSTRSRIGSSSNNLFEFYNADENEGFQIRISADGTMQVRTKAGGDTAIIQVNTFTGAAYNFNGNAGGTGTACTVFTVGGCTTATEPNALYYNLILAPSIFDAGFKMLTFSEYLDLRNTILSLQVQIDVLKGIK